MNGGVSAETPVASASDEEQERACSKAQDRTAGSHARDLPESSWRPRQSGRGGSDHASVANHQPFFGIVIAMYFDDHGPPHFHARHADGRAKVRIDTLEVIDSDLGRRQLRFVLAWAELHQEELFENWRRARAGDTLREIEPLR
jgi:hypothetical protein